MHRIARRGRGCTGSRGGTAWLMIWRLRVPYPRWFPWTQSSYLPRRHCSRKGRRRYFLPGDYEGPTQLFLDDIFISHGWRTAKSPLSLFFQPSHSWAVHDESRSHFTRLALHPGVCFFSSMYFSPQHRLLYPRAVLACAAFFASRVGRADGPMGGRRAGEREGRGGPAKAEGRLHPGLFSLPVAFCRRA